VFILCPSEKSLTGLYCRAIKGYFGLAIISISCMPCKICWFFLTFRNDFGSSVYSSTCELSQKITTFFLWVWVPVYMGSHKFCTEQNWHGSTLCLHRTGGTWRIWMTRCASFKKSTSQTCTLGRSNIWPLPLVLCKCKVEHCKFLSVQKLVLPGEMWPYMSITLYV